MDELMSCPVRTVLDHAAANLRLRVIPSEDMESYEVALVLTDGFSSPVEAGAERARLSQELGSALDVVQIQPTRRV
jgi:hypothetical protein